MVHIRSMLVYPISNFHRELPNNLPPSPAYTFQLSFPFGIKVPFCAWVCVCAWAWLVCCISCWHCGPVALSWLSSPICPTFPLRPSLFILDELSALHKSVFRVPFVLCNLTWCNVACNNACPRAPRAVSSNNNNNSSHTHDTPDPQRVRADPTVPYRSCWQKLGMQQTRVCTRPPPATLLSSQLPSSLPPS